ncbi:ATP-binding protein [Nevskia ramosa]|uniref:ATP-binding protein n=1 Tax=Nevskia ramosa TaxID=64002 RepID=UPI002355E4A0|nr:ATP-binding protein [Nevskia ramosa]
MTSSSELRVLVVGPTSRDAQLVRAVLAENGIASESCASLVELCSELEARGAGAILVAEETLSRAECLSTWMQAQPTWSDLPLLVIARPGADSAIVASVMARLGSVAILERPTRVSALLSSVQVALRARKRQYQIRDQLADLENARATLQRNDHRKDEFLAILAHELRNPLAPISNALELLKRADSSDPMLQKIGQMMTRQVGNLNRLVDDLLEISRITRDKIELKKVTVTLDSILQTAIEASQPLLDTHRHQLHVSLPSGLPLLLADPLRLSQVFANLLNNAAKFTEPGGQIWLSIQQEPKALSISVRDNGIGIRPDMQARIFELFAQADEITSRSQGGLGIGLMLVRRLVELHGGTVKVISEGPGRGSEFIVRLPLTGNLTQTVSAPSGKPSSPAGLGQQRILVVDDNLDAASSLCQLLELWGAETQVAGSGQEALDILGDFRPDVAILDIGMQGMDGLELAGRIRARPELSGLFLIALTGWGQEEDIRRTLKSGFDRHLVKPVNLELLQTLLREHPRPL